MCLFWRRKFGLRRQQPKANTMPQVPLNTAEGYLCEVVLMQNLRLMGAISVLNVVLFLVHLKQRRLTISACMNVNPHKVTCVRRLNIPQNVKSQPFNSGTKHYCLGVMVLVKLNKTDEKVVATLQAEGKELTLQDIVDKSGEPSKKVFRSLRKLFENEIVSTQARKYALMINDTKDIKAKLAAKGKEGSKV